ncbi:TRAP transporter substrate-binding protein [Granulosicoccus sp. 3-233]|uniref:TRAP transporter substrate-binding protein n=1 Tax=Granulosicoccus sp. 3-233 TaxID=3417969 RepID=UPI003D331875
MNRLKKRLALSCLAASLLSSLTLVGASNAVAADVTLRMHQFLPAQANVPKLILDVWADDIEEASGGRIEIQRFPSMQLGGKPPELIDQAIDGVADIVWTVVGYTPGRYPRTEVFELPFMMTDGEAVSRAYWSLFEKEMKDTEFANLKVLGTWVHGPGVLHSAKPISSVDDMKGVKMRGGSRMVNKLLESLGATPIGMPVPAVPEALSKGVITATTIPWEVTTSLKVSELVENHTEFGNHALYTLTFVLAMNKARYEALPEDLQQVIDENSGMEFSAFAGRTQQEADAPARELAVQRGNTINVLDDEEAARWEEKAAPVIEEWVADMNDQGIDGQALLDEARALIEEYTEAE